MKFTSALFGGALLAARSASAIELSPDDDESIKSAALVVAEEMMTWYSGDEPGQIPGLLPQPHYWWQAGAMFGSLIDYWYYTGDDRYNEVTTEALLFQVGPDDNYMPPNQSRSLGNDDQAFWGIAAMSAAEVNFPNPPDDQPQWLALAQAVFNSQAVRWNLESCNGGLKWQIFTFNNGYDYKNSISNGCFFNLAARLGAYTGNDTYLEWATRTWDWSEDIGLISEYYQVFDGSDDKINCTELNHIQWSYNAGVYLLGAATMWNLTSGDVQAEWETRVRGILEAGGVFFNNAGIMYEVACEAQGNCNIDQQSFKAYWARWMAASTKVAPWVSELVMDNIRTSAVAAAATCIGGTNGTTCGTRWTEGSWDGTYGVGQQMSALETIQSLLIDTVPGPVTANSGGTSVGDPNAGTTSSRGGEIRDPSAITTADRAGAGILTVLVIVGILGGGWWMMI